MALIRKLLFPFSLLYAGVMVIRNKMYDAGLLHSESFPFPVICVGNLSVGGTGKTPMIEYLIRQLKNDFRLAILSRGYRRETSGFIILSGQEDAREVGDEPLQFKSKFPEVVVVVDEKRVHGIHELEKKEPAPEVILLDDAFQHRKVAAGLNILLTSYGDLYSEDHVLPTGSLREPRAGAKRAQLVVVTKCPPGLSSEERMEIQNKLKLEGAQLLFFSTIGYQSRVVNNKGSIELSSLRSKPFTLVTGIANPKPLLEYLQSQGLDFDHLSFPDHHNFTQAEQKDIARRPLVLTTEKDYMRLQGKVDEGKLFYLPMQMEFLNLEEKSTFDQAVSNFLKKK